MPQTYKPEQSLGFVLNDVARLMRRNFNRRVQELDLTQAQWQVLIHISRNQGMKQSELADILEVQRASHALAEFSTRSMHKRNQRKGIAHNLQEERLFGSKISIDHCGGNPSFCSNFTHTNLCIAALNKKLGRHFENFSACLLPITALTRN